MHAACSAPLIFTSCRLCSSANESQCIRCSVVSDAIATSRRWHYFGDSVPNCLHVYIPAVYVVVAVFSARSLIVAMDFVYSWKRSKFTRKRFCFQPRVIRPSSALLNIHKVSKEECQQWRRRCCRCLSERSDKHRVWPRPNTALTEKATDNKDPLFLWQLIFPVSGNLTHINFLQTQNACVRINTCILLQTRQDGFHMPCAFYTMYAIKGQHFDYFTL